MKRRKAALTDQVTVTLNEARHILAMGPEQFRRQWKQYYQFEVKHTITTRGLKLRLVDLVRAVYPDIAGNDLAVHLMAQDFIWRLKAHRAERHPNSIVNQRRRKDGEAAG